MERKSLFKRIVGNQLGFDLVSVSIAMGIATVAALGISTIIRNMNKASSGVQNSLDFQLAVSHMMSTFSNSSSCRSSLFGVDVGTDPGLNPSLSPFSTAVQQLTVGNPNDAAAPYETNRWFPGSQTLYINSISASVVPNSLGQPKWVRYLVSGEVGSATNPPVYRYGWARDVRFNVVMNLESTQGGPYRCKDVRALGRNTPALPTMTPPNEGANSTPRCIKASGVNRRLVGGSATGQYLFTRTLMVSTQLVDHSSSVPDATPAPSSATVPQPVAGGTNTWAANQCGLVSEGFRIQGIGECYWCPRTNDTDAGSVACSSQHPTAGTSPSSPPGPAGPADPGPAGPADPGPAGPADPGPAGPADPGPGGSDGPPPDDMPESAFYRYKSPMKLAVEEARILNAVFTVIPETYAQPVEPGAVDGEGGVGDPPPPIDPSPTPGAVPSIAPGSQWASSLNGQPVTCAAGYYQAGVRFWNVPVTPSNVPAYTPQPCYATGKYATCSTTTVVNTQTTSVDTRYQVYCCEVETD